MKEAHNTHDALSVHVHQSGAQNLSEVSADSLADALSYRTHCILHEFYAPYQFELDELLRGGAPHNRVVDDHHIPAR